MNHQTTNFNEALATGKIVTHPQLSYCPETPAAAGRGLSGVVTKVFFRYLFLVLVALGCLFPASAQVNCSSFSSTGTCGVGSGQGFNPIAGANPPSVSGSRILLVPTGTTHQGTAVNYTTKVPVQAFTANFTFVPNGQNVAFVLQDTTDTPGYQGTDFVAGAGCEAGFFQAFGSFPPPNNIFALELDSWSYLGSVQDFTYSSAQIYQAGQSPCNPNDSGPNYVLIDKISTSPVPLNSPANSQGTSTGDTYSAALTYSGTTLTLNMYDVTAGGACPGAKCFTHTWNVDIPSWVGADTAYVGLTAAPGETSNYPLYIGSFSYSGGSATQPAPPTSPTTQAATPTFSPAAGTYTSAQSVSVSDATSGATIYYTTNGSTPTTSSTKYTSPVSVGSTETLQAIAAATGDANSAVASAAYTMSSASPDPGNTPVIDYASGFASHPSQLWLGNSAVYSGSSLELTNSSGYAANNAWYKTPVNVQAFTTTFTWNATCPAKPAQCGDGMGFMIIGKSNPSSFGYNYSGSWGSQLSWSRCSGSSGTTDCPSVNSILVKFDLYNNSTGTDGANLTGFYSGGVAPQPPQAEYQMAPSGISMQSGHLMKATLTYNGTVLMETVTDTVTGATYRNSYSANIPALVGGDTAFVGFGGSSGGASVTQNIQSWAYAVDSPGN
jgi:hypothetical protein